MVAVYPASSVWILKFFKMPVSYVGLLSDFSGMSSKSVSTSPSFSLISKVHFSAGFLPCSVPRDLSLIIDLCAFVALGTMNSRNLE
jgi:hypothetical protein